MENMKLTRKQAQTILDVTFPEYNGRKIALECAEKITFWDTNWGGGTRKQYKAIKHKGQVAQLPVPAPWVNPFEGTTFDMQPGLAIVTHSIFCGKDCGITITMHPADMPQWLN